MHDVNWWLMALSFLAGLVLTFLLMIRKVTREVPVTLRWMPSDRGARMTGFATVRRLDFGIGAGDWADPDLIGLDVRVEFDLELVPCAGS